MVKAAARHSQQQAHITSPGTLTFLTVPAQHGTFQEVVGKQIGSKANNKTGPGFTPLTMLPVLRKVLNDPCKWMLTNATLMEVGLWDWRSAGDKAAGFQLSFWGHPPTPSHPPPSSSCCYSCSGYPPTHITSAPAQPKGVTTAHGIGGYSNHCQQWFMATLHAVHYPSPPLHVSGYAPAVLAHTPTRCRPSKLPNPRLSYPLTCPWAQTPVHVSCLTNWAYPLCSRTATP
jgi:hypothetical protein